MNKDGSCYLNIVEKAVESVKNVVDEKKTNIIIRSTVPPNTSKILNCYFMPEFLTEKNWQNDFKNCEHWIFGLNGSENDFFFRIKINKLFEYAQLDGKILYNNLHFVSTEEAELIKYFRNTFLALKVSFCNEIFEYCQLKNINYENVRFLATLDKRVNESHSIVPGHDGKFGYGGTCFPKDTNALLFDMKKIGQESYIVRSSVERNKNVDRPTLDGDKGRAFV